MSIDPLAVSGKRLAALDYGEARIGVAVCDEMHIVVSTRPIIKNDSKMWDVLLERLDDDRIDVVLVGVPRRHDDATTAIIEKIITFIKELQHRTVRPVIEVDEAFSTQRAKEIMLKGNVRKKRRAQKGTKDVFAAAVILQDVLEELR